MRFVFKISFSIASANFLEEYTGTFNPLIPSSTQSLQPMAFVVIMALPIAHASIKDFGSPSL